MNVVDGEISQAGLDWYTAPNRTRVNANVVLDRQVATRVQAL